MWTRLRILSQSPYLPKGTWQTNQDKERALFCICLIPQSGVKLLLPGSLDKVLLYVETQILDIVLNSRDSRK